MRLIIQTLCIATAVALSTVIVSCSKEDKDMVTDSISTDQSSLKVEAGIYNSRSLVSAGTISAFPSGASLGLFITPNTLDNYYDTKDNSANVKATYLSSAWSLTPPVLLTSTTAYVYAYYPYNASASDAHAIPVDHTSQTDYMYGKYNSGVNRLSSTVNISMKHALSMIQFKLSKTDFPWTGQLTKIEIANKSGKTVLYSAGTMEIAKGAITYTNGQNASASIENSEGLLTIPTTASTDESTYPKLLVLPVANSGATGDLVMKFTIDGKVYTCDVPAGTVWGAGTKNTYTVTIQGHELKLDTNVTIEDWLSGITGSVAPIL
ncbi:MAG: fimbrillin family protein [Bacteroidota bacterium]|nr:fimbrillin family protein [Bacteroidota bacterium]MDP4268520.1 fimbrillin family protein [Bacteroidota bacterium]